MRKALFRKDLWKDVGTKSGEEGPAPEKPTLHQHHYKYTRRVRGVGILQIICAAFLYFISIFLPIFGTRGYYTQYLIPMGSVAGPVTVISGMFARETCRNRKKWMIIVYMVLCSVTLVTSFVQFIGAWAAFGYEEQGWAEDLITEPVIAVFRYISYVFIIILDVSIILLAVFSIVLDVRYLSTKVKNWCQCDWMPEKGESLLDNEEQPVTTV